MISKKILSSVLALAMTVSMVPSYLTAAIDDTPVSVISITPGQDDAKTGTGSMTINLKIKQSITPTVSLADWQYKGTPSTPDVDGNTGGGDVTYQYKVKGADDTSYTDTVPTAVGEYTVKANIAETAEYKAGSATANFKITPMTKGMTITLVISEYGVSLPDCIELVNEPKITNGKAVEGTEIKFKLKEGMIAGSVKNGETVLAADESGIYTVVVTADTTVTVDKAKASLEYSAYTWTGEGVSIDKYLTVKDGDKVLVNGTDYITNYENNVEIGYKTAKITISGIGEYKGSVSKAFTIKPAKQAAPKLTTSDGKIYVSWDKTENYAVGYQVIYDKIPEFDSSADNHSEDYHTTTVTDLETLTKTLQAYCKPGEVWYVKVRAFITSDGTVNGTRYGSFSKTSKITVKGDLKTAAITYPSYTYTGSEIKPEPTVKDTKGNVLKAEDYTVTYTDNKAVGIATMTIKGKGAYQGTITKTFVVKPARNEITAITASTGAFKITWKKGTEGTVGYQVLYSQDKAALEDAAGETKDADAKKYVHSYTSADLDDLSENFSRVPESGETWYVKIRSFVTKDGKTTSTRYGNYSTVKSIKVK